MGRLTNKTAVITGGTTGIGFATAKQFIEEGARVIITGRNEERLREAVEVREKGDRTQSGCIISCGFRHIG